MGESACVWVGARFSVARFIIVCFYMSHTHLEKVYIL